MRSLSDTRFAPSGRGSFPEAKIDLWIMAQLYQRLKALYQKEGGANPEPQPGV